MADIYKFVILVKSDAFDIMFHTQIKQGTLAKRKETRGTVKNIGENVSDGTDNSWSMSFLHPPKLQEYMC